MLFGESRQAQPALRSCNYRKGTVLDPFSTKLRRYIPWLEYQELEEEHSAGSLIGESEINENTINDRLEVLRESEALFGFVYFGEKRWLECHLESGGTLSYPSWIAAQLNDTIFAGGLRYSYGDKMLTPDGMSYGSWGSVAGRWSSESEDISHLWIPAELSPTSIEFFCVSIVIMADESGPSENQYCLAFEVLHDLA